MKCTCWDRDNLTGSQDPSKVKVHPRPGGDTGTGGCDEEGEVGWR